MKKLLSMLLLVVMAVACCAGALAEENEAVQAIVDKGTLTVGVKEDVVGFGLYNTETGEYEGLEIDLAKKIAETMGVENVEFVAVTAATRGQLLDSGDIDMVLATFTITEERKLSYNFSTPYYTDAVTVMVMKDSGIESLADLSDKIIGVSTGSTSMAALEEAAGTTLTFEEFATYPEIKLALTVGTIDAFCVDGSILSSYLDDDTVLLDERFSPQEYGIATKLDNTDLAEYVDALIVEWLEDGTIDELIEANGVVDSYVTEEETEAE